MVRFLSRIRGLFNGRITASGGLPPSDAMPFLTAVGGHALTGQTSPFGPDAARNRAAAPRTGLRRGAGAGCLHAYLRLMGNTPEDILTTSWLLGRPRVILEVGCGSGAIAREIALKNPDTGVIATDLYQCPGSPREHASGYRKTALAWQQRQLDAQQNCPENLVLLRAEIDFLRYLPERRVDTVLLINPEPRVGTFVLDLLARPHTYRALKPGRRQIVVLPFSREMGVYAYGGWQFDHDADYSQGLGFMMGSSFLFSRIETTVWGVDIHRESCYSRHSTQCNVYAAGALKDAITPSRR